MSEEALRERLRAEAGLLLQRERELVELRRVRQRTEKWLRAFHDLSLQPGSGEPRDLLASWAERIVGALGFERAVALEVDPETGQVGRSLIDPEPAAVPPALPLATVAALDDHPSGARDRDAEAAAPIAHFAGELGFTLFLWLWHRPPAGQALLLLAGYSARTAVFHALPEHDRSHFLLLGQHLAALRSGQILMARSERDRAELAAANRELDARLRELRLAQDKLIESSRQVAEASRRAGMADVVTGVLHNVGNVLTSVNVSTEALIERTRGSRLGRLGEAAALLERAALPGTDPAAGATGDETGPRVVAYLRELAARAEEERAGMLAELRGLQEHVEHLKWVVGKQQQYAGAAGVSERCTVAGLVDDAWALARPQLAPDLVLLREGAADLELVTERHKVVQVLVNLLANAGQATDQAPGAPRAIRLRWGPVAGERLAIAVEDCGAGVREEHRARLFTHGFTTRPGGHGFGLHASAIAARDLGGSLRCESDGPGLGATFILEIAAGRGRGPEGS